MHKNFCIKVPETLDAKEFIAPITIMTRSPAGNTRSPLCRDPGFCTSA